MESPRLVTPIINLATDQLRRIPKTILKGMLGFLGEDAKSLLGFLDMLYGLTDEKKAEIDADFLTLLDGIAQKDHEAVGSVVQKWGIAEESLPGYIILRLLEPIRVEKDRFGIGGLRVRSVASYPDRDVYILTDGTRWDMPKGELPQPLKNIEAEGEK